jgi:DNA repair exonuclease SbcCD ATPase subunit
MERVSSEGVQQRLQLEEFYTDSFAQKVKTLQGDIAQESERLDSQVSRLNLLIDQRFANAEQEVDRQREIIDQALAEMKDDSLNKFSAEFEEYNGSVRIRLGSFSSSLEEKLNTISAGVDVKNDEFKRMIETAQSDMTVWQSKTLQQLNEAKAEVTGKISDLKSSAADSIYEINAEFEREKEGYLKHSSLRQQEMEKQLNVINDNIVRLENDLKLRTGEAIQDFSERYTDILNTLDLKSSEIFHKIETDSEEFRKTASDTRTKVNSAREQLFGRIEEKAGTLTVTLNEIDKRLKAFVDQTKVFDKAEELKGRLKQDIDTLKSEIDRLKVDRKELRETDKNFQKMRKMEEELNLRLNELLAQRRKVDEMEKDFTRLMETSSSISARLDDVTSGSDMLHSIQAKLRQVDDLVAEVDRKYVRLEHKENLLDSTAQGVDRSFESMEKLEGRIKQLEGNFSKFLMNLKNTSDRISVLSNNKADADEAVNKINSLDSLLSELDGKMSEMQKARTWLADTETRLEQINKSAQENVRIFKSLVESDSAKDARNKASSSDTRALVKKLAHQGWSVPEIAKTTKLSRGEVELILELIPE